MEEDIKCTEPSISLSVGDEIVGCLDFKFEVLSIDYKNLTVTTKGWRGGRKTMSFKDVTYQYKKVVKPYYDTVDIQVGRKTMANISLNEGDSIIVDQGNKAKVLSIDCLNEKVTISKYGECRTLTFDEIECGNFKKVIYQSST